MSIRHIVSASLITPLVLFALVTAPASAATITFNFDCNITGPSCPSTSPAGTLQITDSAVNANWVDLLLTLGSGAPQQFYVNYVGFPLPAGYSFQATGTTVNVSQNTAQADGYTSGFFDLSIPDTGNISGNPFATTLMLSNGVSNANLDAVHFAALTTNGALYAALLKTRGQGWFGATSCTGCPSTPPSVAEPATITLLGIGLAGAVGARRRRQRAARS